jgi:hypothetical protein
MRRGDAALAQRPPAARVVVGLARWSLAGRLRSRPGRSRGPLTAGTASTTASSSSESWVLAADRHTAKGEALAVDQQVVLGAGLAAVCRVRAS